VSYLDSGTLRERTLGKAGALCFDLYDAHVWISVFKKMLGMLAWANCPRRFGKFEHAYICPSTHLKQQLSLSSQSIVEMYPLHQASLHVNIGA
jgi:hypothetical protein